MDINVKNILKGNNKKYHLIFAIVVLFVILYFLVSPPFAALPVTIHVSTNESVGKIANELKDKNIIRSKTVFLTLVKVLGGDRQIPLGDYFFERNFTVLRIASMLSSGSHNINPIKITIREGLTNEQIAIVLENNKPNFKKDDFLKKVENKQGYLFPDTYFIFPLATNDEIINMMDSNFRKHIASFKDDISKSKHSLSDIITMASIIEKEAQGELDSPVISGILWKRIKIKMPLQVDADKDTYKIPGLPALPISNPGLVAIQSSLYPKDSPYLYYLHGHDGMVHYAQTFSEHKKNISLYLK